MFQNSSTSPMGIVVVILVSSFLTLCNGVCINTLPSRSSTGIKPDGCMDGDIKRDFKSTWFTENCEECTCTLEGLISCCPKVLKPILQDMACMAVQNKTTCAYEVKRTDGSSEPCYRSGLM